MCNSRYATGDGRYIDSNDPDWIREQIAKAKLWRDKGGQYRVALENRLADLHEYQCPNCQGKGKIVRLEAQ